MAQPTDIERDKAELTSQMYSSDPSDQADAFLALQEIEESDPRHAADHTNEK
ncbi:hypothetical protein [Streptomyces olivaceoviridis]|uniref:hypothetical protein n=1 Tax=Streptomyces olivaceoviridis TaxID=1921 RepID=UPI00367A9139